MTWRHCQKVHQASAGFAPHGAIVYSKRGARARPIAPSQSPAALGSSSNYFCIAKIVWKERRIVQDVRTRACAPSATSAAAASRVTRIALTGALARRRSCFKRSRARVSRTFFCERQPPAYSLCLLSLAGQSKSAPLCMLHTIFMVSCGLKFFFLLSENAHICTFQLFFSQRKD